MRTMSGKVKWAIGLLVVWMVLGFGQMVQNSGSASFLLVIVVLMECLPTIAVIVLTHYDHKYAAPKNGTFTLLRVWALALIWFQPVLSLLSYIAAGAFTSFILGVWVASCLLLLLSCCSSMGNIQSKAIYIKSVFPMNQIVFIFLHAKRRNYSLELKPFCLVVIFTTFPPPIYLRFSINPIKMAPSMKIFSLMRYLSYKGRQQIHKT